MPAEGLLGASRLVPLGPPSQSLRRPTWPGGQVVEPILFMSGVRPTSTLDECKRQEKFLEKDAG
jgi:hypothetical protein